MTSKSIIKAFFEFFGMRKSSEDNHREDEALVQASNRLTRFSPASVRELLVISIPLMVASLSSLLMNFCDRVILAHYSTDAMNAAITAGMAANVFSLGAVGIAVIAEVFVGKKNGAGALHEAARPAWQMMWFALATSVVFVPLALFLSPVVVPADQFDGQAVDYFRAWMLFGPMFPLAGALSAFFIGIGRVKIITITAITSNLANIALDYLLIFGIPGYLEPWGCTGAAVATGIAQTLQVAILATVFLSKPNRTKYRTNDFSFDWSLCKACLKIGSPSAIGHMMEISAWALILQLMALAGPAYITSLAIGQNLIILFAFLSQGLQKGVLAVAANLIGANAHALMGKLIRSAMTLLAIIAALLFIPLVIYPDPVISIFLLEENGRQSDLFAYALQTGLWVWLYIFLDGIVWVIAGVLTAHSDTKFIMVANALAAWLLAVMPTYFFLNILKSPPSYCWAIMDGYALLNALLFIWRLRRRKAASSNLAFAT